MAPDPSQPRSPAPRPACRRRAALAGALLILLAVPQGTLALPQAPVALPPLEVDVVPPVGVELGDILDSKDCSKGWHPIGPCCPPNGTTLGCCRSDCAPKPRLIRGTIEIRHTAVQAGPIAAGDLNYDRFVVAYTGDFNDRRCRPYVTEWEDDGGVDAPVDLPDGAGLAPEVRVGAAVIPPPALRTTVSLVRTTVEVRCFLYNGNGFGGAMGISTYPLCSKAAVQGEVNTLPTATLRARVACEGYKPSDYDATFGYYKDKWVPSGFETACDASGTPVLGSPTCSRAASGVAAMEISLYCSGTGRQNLDWAVRCTIGSTPTTGSTLADDLSIGT